MLFNVIRIFLALMVVSSISWASPVPDQESLNPRSPNPAPFANVPNNPTKKSCRRVTDCSCPAVAPNSKTVHSTSCINGFCSCDNAAVNFFATNWMKALAAVGNAGITKVIGQLMKGMADVKEVLGTIAGAVLGPEAKAALKGALNVIPETGPSHIDKATKGILAKAL